MQVFCYNCLLLVFLVSTKARLFISNESDRIHREEHLLRRTQDKKLLFGDVLKNITRVNNALQDLIKNYAQLQKNYKTQEESSLYSDSEIDEEFKPKNKQFRQHLKESTENIGTLRPIHFKSTLMALSEESSEEYAPKHIKSDNKMKILKEQKIQHLNVKKSSTKKLKTEVEQALEQVIKKISKKLVPLERLQQSSSKEIDSWSYETNEKLEKGVQTKKMTKYGSKKRLQSSEDRGGMSIVEPTSYKDIVPRVAENKQAPKYSMKKVIQSESFPQKEIWDDIVNMKPVKLKTEKEITYNNRKASNTKQLSKPLLSSKEKGILPIYRQQLLRSRNINGDSFEDEKIFNKAMFKTKVLRKAYGDACLKVVIRKCYKACTKALKVTCKNYECKHGLKPTFKQRARRYCIKEFDTTQNVTTQNNETHNITSGTLDGAPVAIYEGGQKNSKGVHPVYSKEDRNMRAVEGHAADDGFVDITRNGYLAAACLPDTRPVARAGNGTAIVEGKLNILRDRFERECKHSSADKCTKACIGAVREACAAVSCKGGKKRNFEKNCKKECQASYGYKSAGSDVSGSKDDVSEDDDYDTDDEDASGSSSASNSNETSKGNTSQTTLPSIIKKELYRIREEKKNKKALKKQKKAAKLKNVTITQKEPIKQQAPGNFRSGLSSKLNTEPIVSPAPPASSVLPVALANVKPLVRSNLPILRHIFFNQFD